MCEERLWEDGSGGLSVWIFDEVIGRRLMGMHLPLESNVRPIQHGGNNHIEKVEAAMKLAAG